MLGYIACFMTTIAYLPQVRDTWSTKQCKMSPQTLGILLIGLLLWIAYGVVQHAGPLIASSALSMAQLLFLSYHIKLNKR